ncbi:MAG: patatin-like phospholipase family protein [Parvibaculum sp.]
MSMSKIKIGIAFGSGVARGWAHIGVLKSLTKAGFAPEIISGTSIGALVGGSYAAGKLNQLEQFALSFHGRKLINLLDLRLGGAGLIGGKRLERLMEQHLGDVQIEHLGRTFVAVATELSTGHEAWLREGSIVNAIRASYALPGLFEPVLHDGRWLIDGALVNPIPVSACRAMGARLVIAVNLNSDAHGISNHFDGHMIETMRTEQHPASWRQKRHAKQASKTGEIQKKSIARQILGSRRETPGLTSVMVGALNIMQDRLSRSRLAADPADVTITPHVGHISLIDFDKAQELIAKGEAAATHAVPFIERALSQMNGGIEPSGLQPVAI